MKRKCYKKAALWIALYLITLNLGLYIKTSAKSMTITVPTDHPTIQDAINAANSGDTIIVLEGEYNEGQINVNKSLTLVANGTVIVNGLQKGHVFYVTANNVTIKEFVVNGSKPKWPYSAICITNVQNCNIENSILKYNYYGILVNRSCDSLLKGNTAINNQYGIFLENSDHNVIEENNATNNKSGIYLDSSQDNIIKQNNATNNESHGIALISSGYNLIERNIIKNNNDSGVLLYTFNRHDINHSDHNVVKKNNARNNQFGIFVRWSHHNVIEENNATNNKYYGIYLRLSECNVVDGNNVTKNGWGIRFDFSHSNIVKKNNASNNKYGVHLCGSDRNVIEENTANKNTFYGIAITKFKKSPSEGNAIRKNEALENGDFDLYWDRTGTHNVWKENNCKTKNWKAIIRVPTDYKSVQNAINAAHPRDIIQVAAGTYYEHVVINKSLAIVGKSCNSIINGNGTENIITITADNVTLSGFTIRNGFCGILLWFSSKNVIFGNTISNNLRGICLSNSSNNTLYHNNFVNNTQQLEFFGISAIFWDNGIEGNYWDDYNGTDIDKDGLGDASYIIDKNNHDRHPLMGPLTEFDITCEGQIYHVDVISNSTISEFHFTQSDKLVKFNVTGLNGIIGFCRVTIPKALMWCDDPAKWIVIVNGNSPTYFRVIDTANYTYLYFTYGHSAKEVSITSTHVVPEFPTWMPRMLVFVILIIVIAIYKPMHRTTR